MKQLNSSFITSAADKSGWPEASQPEVVVVGRSNVGKSSFINALTNRKKLAYVGNTPGKTQLINFFDIDGSWTLVDVPGYGYAKLSKSQIEKMGKMMDQYFGERNGITCVVSLVDARHGPTRDDLDMIDYFKQNHFPMIIAATKIDKIPKTKRLKAIRDISQKLQLPARLIYPVSSTEKTGFDEVYQALMKQMFPESEAEKTEEPEKAAEDKKAEGPEEKTES